MRRLAFLVLVLLAVSCTAQPIADHPPTRRAQPARLAGPDVAMTEAIKLALAEAPLLPPGSFPDKLGRQGCTIIGGGPYPGIHLAGACQTAAHADGSGGWLITFTEYWDAHLFRYAGESAIGEHSYHVTFVIDRHAIVVLRDGGGNFPPQDVM